MATGAGADASSGASATQGSATRGSAPDSDDIDTEWEMDRLRGLRQTPGGGGSAFDPDSAPPPESLDPDYGEARAAAPPRQPVLGAERLRACALQGRGWAGGGTQGRRGCGDEQHHPRGRTAASSSRARAAAAAGAATGTPSSSSSSQSSAPNPSASHPGTGLEAERLRLCTQVLFSFLVLDVYAQIKMHNDQQEATVEHEVQTHLPLRILRHALAEPVCVALQDL